jgi:hypothetical protein
VPISHGHGRSPPPVLANEGGPDKGVPPREGGLPASRFGLYPLVWGSLFWGHFARRCLTGMSAASFFNPAAQNQAQADRPHVVVAPLQGGVLSACYEPHFRPAALQWLGQCRACPPPPPPARCAHGRPAVLCSPDPGIALPAAGGGRWWRRWRHIRNAMCGSCALTSGLSALWALRNRHGEPAQGGGCRVVRVGWLLWSSILSPQN